jgi:hypothetical protein
VAFSEFEAGFDLARFKKNAAFDIPFFRETLYIRHGLRYEAPEILNLKKRKRREVPTLDAF